MAQGASAEAATRHRATKKLRYGLAMTWVGVAELFALGVLVCLVAPLVILYARRRWIARAGSMFDCSVRLSERIPSSGWVLGVARYSGDALEWFRSFSLSLHPQLTFERAATSAGEQRVPDALEAVTLYANQRVVRLHATAGRDGTPAGSWELSMSPDSLTGLLSWLEAAPPGEGRYTRSPAEH